MDMVPPISDPYPIRLHPYGSHISATPPPSPPLSSQHPVAEPPHIPNRFAALLSSIRAPKQTSRRANPNPKVNLNPKSKPKVRVTTDPPSGESALDRSSFPAADFSTLPVRIQNSSDGVRPVSKPFTSASSFSSLVKSRQSGFDPSIFDQEVVPAADARGGNDEASGASTTASAFCAHKGLGKRASVLKTLHNWIGDVPKEPAHIQKRFKHSNEGNFVRLNINGYGKTKFSFRGGWRKGSTNSYSSRYKRRWKKGKLKNSSGVVEGTSVEGEDALFSDAILNRKVKGYDLELVQKAVSAVREDPSNANLLTLLKLTHGYDAFREGQLEAIKQVLEKKSTMLVLPTGAGKSLCYQIPALVLPGVALVVSPLIALMVDQLQKLPPMLPGAHLCSIQRSEEIDEIINQLHAGTLKVLFVSPERFSSSEFLILFEDNPCISMVVIDEAHCISEWSHNFRPSYMRLRGSMLKKNLHVECVLAMTATATTKTLNDIMGALEIQPDNLIQTSHIRENLQLSVTSGENRLKDLLALVKSFTSKEVKSIIVYCKFQAETEMISKYLCDNNIPSKSYHSGVLAKERIRTQELFISNKIRVVVATVAFGMGLDKSDIGSVIHYSLPESLEEYVQETGRAGRDGRLSYCHLFLDDITYYRLRSFLHSDGTDEYAISRLLAEIFMGDNDVNIPGKLCSLLKDCASRKFDMKEEVILTILTHLELSKVQYIILEPQLDVSCTLFFHKTSPSALAVTDVFVASILAKSETKDGGYLFDILDVANDLHIDVCEVLSHLQNLKNTGEITYDRKNPAFCYRIVRKPDDIISLTTDIAKWLADVQNSKVWKLDTMFDVASYALKDCKGPNGCSGSVHTACLQSKIADYFSCEQVYTESGISAKIKSSPFLRADIKVFLQNNDFVKFTPRAVARIMHGIPSPAFPSAHWSKCHFWGRYTQVDFSAVMEAAKDELKNFVGKDRT